MTVAESNPPAVDMDTIFTDDHVKALKIFVPADADVAKVKKFAKILGATTVEHVSELFKEVSRLAVTKPAGLKSDQLFGSGDAFLAEDAAAFAKDMTLTFATDADVITANADALTDALGADFNMSSPNFGTEYDEIIISVVTIVKAMYQGKDYKMARAIADTITAIITDDNGGADLGAAAGQLIPGGLLHDAVVQMGGGVPTDGSMKKWKKLFDLAGVLAEAAADNGIFGTQNIGNLFKKDAESGEYMIDTKALGGTDFFEAMFSHMLANGAEKNTCGDKRDKECETPDLLIKMMADFKVADFGSTDISNGIDAQEFLDVMQDETTAGKADVGLTNAEWDMILGADENNLTEFVAAMKSGAAGMDKMEITDVAEDLFLIAMGWKLTPTPLQDKINDELEAASDLNGCC